MKGLARLLGYREVPPRFFGVVYTLGFITRVIRTPGPTWILPLIERMVLVDGREQTLDVPTKEVLYTAENQPIEKADFDVYFRVRNPVKALTAVGNLVGAIQGLVNDARRDAVSRIPEEELTTPVRQAELRGAVIERLEPAAQRWGIKITEVALSDVVRSPVVDEARARLRAADDESARIQTLSKAEVEAYRRERKAQGEDFMHLQELDRLVEAAQKGAYNINILGLSDLLRLLGIGRKQEPPEGGRRTQ